MRLTKKKILTKISAMFMAAAVITTTAMAGFTPAQNLVGGKKNAEVTAEASSSNVLSSKDRGVIYANSRTDFRDETIYFLITTRFYDVKITDNEEAQGKLIRWADDFELEYKYLKVDNQFDLIYKNSKINDYKSKQKRIALQE